MARQLTDDELNIRRKARRRLIGAIALTLAVVVILPMVLEREPKPAGQDIDLRIPAPEKAGKFIPGVAASEVVEALPVAAFAPAAASAPVAADQVDNVKLPAENQAAASTSRTEAQGKIQPVAVKQPEAKEAEPAKTESKEPEHGKQEQKETGPKKQGAESYIVQVGAYSKPAAAKHELDRLKGWGFKAAYSEKIGDKMRVRVGPYTERDKAEKVRQLLEKHGLHPVVMGKQ